MMPELQTVFIYALKDPRDGAVRYIGKASNTAVRLKEHLRKAKRSEVHSQRWILNLKSLGISPEMEVLDEVPVSQWEFFERAYVKVYREAGADLTNLTDGGDGLTNCSESTRQKLRAANLGKKVYFSPEHRAKIGAARKGHVPSEETKSKISATRKTRTYINGMLGHKHTEESKKLMSDAKKGQGAGEANPFFGHTHTEETLSILRKPKSEEHKQAVSKALTGRTLTPEHCANVSKSMTGIKRGPYKKKVKVPSV